MLGDSIDRLRRFLSGRQTDYRATFDGPRARGVLADLAQFCRANESTAHPDPHMAARLDGRREVWLRIQQHLQLSPEELFSLATGRTIHESDTVTRGVEHAPE